MSKGFAQHPLWSGSLLLLWLGVTPINAGVPYVVTRRGPGLTVCLAQVLSLQPFNVVFLCNINLSLLFHSKIKHIRNYEEDLVKTCHGQKAGSYQRTGLYLPCCLDCPADAKSVRQLTLKGVDCNYATKQFILLEGKTATKAAIEWNFYSQFIFSSWL